MECQAGGGSENRETQRNPMLLRLARSEKGIENRESCRNPLLFPASRFYPRKFLIAPTPYLFPTYFLGADTYLHFLAVGYGDFRFLCVKPPCFAVLFVFNTDLVSCSCLTLFPFYGKFVLAFFLLRYFFYLERFGIKFFGGSRGAARYCGGTG